nr:MAG: hypothetical protein [Molluscum contagiosum virus]
MGAASARARSSFRALALPGPPEPAAAVPVRYLENLPSQRAVPGAEVHELALRAALANPPRYEHFGLRLASTALLEAARLFFSDSRKTRLASLVLRGHALFSVPARPGHA